MSWKWLETAYQFDEEPSGGGGDPPPAEPVVEPVVEPAAEPAVETPPPEPTERDVEPPDIVEPPEPSIEPPAAVVGVPKAFDGLFNPPAPAAQPPAHQPPVHHEPAAPAAPAAPPRVEHPTGDDWLTDPGKAAEQLRGAMDYSNYQAQAPLLKTIEGLRNDFQGMQRGTFEETVRAVQGATQHTRETIDTIYAEKGPFNSDKEFRDNPEVQAEVETIVGECVKRAVWYAEEYGDTSKLATITNDPEVFAHRILALAKVRDNSIPEGSLRPAASPVGPQPPTPAKRDGLTEQERSDLKAARSVEGNTITAKDIIRARKAKKSLVY